MIVSMKKITFLVYHKEYQKFLEDIRERGILHVKEKGKADVSEGLLDEKLVLLNRLTDAIRFLERRNVEDVADTGDASESDGLSILHDLESLRHEYEVSEQNMQLLEKEESQLLPWGEFDWESVSRLHDRGIDIRFMSCPVRKWNPEWEKKYNAFEISKHGTNLNFVVVLKKGEDIDIEADPVRLPSHSLQWLRNEKQNVSKERKRIEKEYDRYSVRFLDILKETKIKVRQELDFENVILNSDKQVDERVIVLEGFIPKEKEKALTDYLDKQPVYYELADPSLGDNIPILLKNNKFANLFEPIGELYAMPQYREIDLTPFFAPFYMMFFGFCLGDAGYGLLLVLAALFYRPRAKKALKPVMSLLIWLGAATVIFGIIGGTFFGINLIEADIPWLERYKGFMLNPKKLFNLALIVGAVQIIFGMFLNAFNRIKQKGFKYSLAVWGWIILLVGGGGIYGLNQAGIVEEQFMNNILTGILIFSGILILLLNNPEKNPLINVGAGLWDTYNMLTGLLGDLLSYIRLFALGISSAVMGFVFNDLAISLSPDVPVIGHLVMIIILLFGHGINIFMSGLGSFVHPMRLTFVEFYKNAGFTGGGKKYKPFKELIDR